MTFSKDSMVMKNALKNHPNHHLRATQSNTKRQHIMLIADNIELAETLQLELSQQNYQVSVIHDGLRGILAVNRMRPDLVVLSWAPPRLSGLEICDRLRMNKREEPIILLTQEDCSKERVAGLNAGADDCLSLPLVKEEFLARINANLSNRERQQAESPSLRLGNILLNRETREVFQYDQYIHLTAKEFNLLEYLMDHNFQVLTRTQILEDVWGYSYTGSSNIIEVYIRYLRKKLGATQKNPIIHTVRSIGYILKETIE